MLDPLGRFSPLSTLGSSLSQGSPLAQLSGLAMTLAGPPLVGGQPGGPQSVQLSASLGAYLGGIDPRAGAHGVASSGLQILGRPPQGDPASYRPWGASQGGLLQLGGSSQTFARYQAAGGPPASGSQALLGHQLGTLREGPVATTFPRVPHVDTEEGWPVASRAVAARLTGSPASQARVHFGGRNPWDNRDGGAPERSAVWSVLQTDDQLRYDADRRVFIQTQPDGSTRDVLGLGSLLQVRRLAGGDQGLALRLGSQHVQSMLASPTKSSELSDPTPPPPVQAPGSPDGPPAPPLSPGAPSPDPESPGLPPIFTPPEPPTGDPSSGIPGGYPNPPDVGIPGGYPNPPSVGIPGGYPNPPSVGIPGGYPNPPSVGIPGGYPNPPSVGIPGGYPYPPLVGIPAGYAESMLTGLPGFGAFLGLLSS